MSPPTTQQSLRSNRDDPRQRGLADRARQQAAEAAAGSAPASPQQLTEEVGLLPLDALSHLGQDTGVLEPVVTTIGVRVGE